MTAMDTDRETVVLTDEQKEWARVAYLEYDLARANGWNGHLRDDLDRMRQERAEILSKVVELHRLLAPFYDQLDDWDE